MNWSMVGTIIGILLVASEQAVQGRNDAPQTEEGLREEAAYTLGVQAYVYGYPLVEMYKTRFIQIDYSKNSQRTRLNQFHHSRRLIDDTFKAVVSPNNDTLYSSAWLDL